MLEYDSIYQKLDNANQNNHTKLYTVKLDKLKTAELQFDLAFVSEMSTKPDSFINPKLYRE